MSSKIISMSYIHSNLMKAQNVVLYMRAYIAQRICSVSKATVVEPSTIFCQLVNITEKFENAKKIYCPFKMKIILFSKCKNCQIRKNNLKQSYDSVTSSATIS